MFLASQNLTDDCYFYLEKLVFAYRVKVTKILKVSQLSFRSNIMYLLKVIGFGRSLNFREQPLRVVPYNFDFKNKIYATLGYEKKYPKRNNADAIVLLILQPFYLTTLIFGDHQITSQI